MANKRHKPEEIVQKLRQVDVLVGQGMARVDAIREVRITEQTYYRWRKQYGGMGTDQRKDLKRLQKESLPVERQESERHRPTPLRESVSRPDAGRRCSEGSCPGETACVIVLEPMAHNSSSRPAACVHRVDPHGDEGQVH